MVAAAWIIWGPTAATTEVRPSVMPAASSMLPAPAVALATISWSGAART